MVDWHGVKYQEDVISRPAAARTWGDEEKANAFNEIKDAPLAVKYNRAKRYNFCAWVEDLGSFFNDVAQLQRGMRDACESRYKLRREGRELRNIEKTSRPKHDDGARRSLIEAGKSADLDSLIAEHKVRIKDLNRHIKEGKSKSKYALGYAIYDLFCIPKDLLDYFHCMGMSYAPTDWWSLRAIAYGIGNGLYRADKIDKAMEALKREESASTSGTRRG
jgi:hypothetical protein